MILSFFLEVGNPLTLKENKFLEALLPESWSQEDGEASSLGEYSPNISDIVFKGINNFYKKSFFKYEGSMSTPPCEESVVHVIMETPIEIHS